MVSASIGGYAGESYNNVALGRGELELLGELRRPCGIGILAFVSALVAIRTGQTHVRSTGQGDGRSCDDGHYPHLLVRRRLCGDGHCALCEQTEALIIARPSACGSVVGSRAGRLAETAGVPRAIAERSL
jgi:hypothetical protein